MSIEKKRFVQGRRNEIVFPRPFLSRKPSIAEIKQCSQWIGESDQEVVGCCGVWVGSCDERQQHTD